MSTISRELSRNAQEYGKQPLAECDADELQGLLPSAPSRLWLVWDRILSDDHLIHGRRYLWTCPQVNAPVADSE